MRGHHYLISKRNKIGRLCWKIVWLLLYRPSPIVLHSWRSALLRLFGADVGRGVHPYPSSRVWAPWNSTLRDGACLGSAVDCYNVARIELGERAIVSQRTYLCTATHDYSSESFDSSCGAHLDRERCLDCRGSVYWPRGSDWRGSSHWGAVCRSWVCGQLDRRSRESRNAVENTS